MATEKLIRGKKDYARHEGKASEKRRQEAAEFDLQSLQSGSLEEGNAEPDDPDKGD